MWIIDANTFQPILTFLYLKQIGSEIIGSMEEPNHKQEIYTNPNISYYSNAQWYEDNYEFDTLPSSIDRYHMSVVGFINGRLLLGGDYESQRSEQKRAVLPLLLQSIIMSFLAFIIIHVTRRDNPKELIFSFANLPLSARQSIFLLPERHNNQYAVEGVFARACFLLLSL